MYFEWVCGICIYTFQSTLVFFQVQKHFLIERYFIRTYFIKAFHALKEHNSNATVSHFREFFFFSWMPHFRRTIASNLSIPIFIMWGPLTTHMFGEKSKIFKKKVWRHVSQTIMFYRQTLQIKSCNINIKIDICLLFLHA